MEKHSYTSTYPPGIAVESGIKHFFEEFYRISDTGPGTEAGSAEEVHAIYADQFTNDATLVMGSRRGVGREEILAIRRSMWDKVAERLHTPIKIFPFGDGSNEVMLYGKVAFLLKAGGRADVEWAARALLVREEGGKWKMGFYQVYLDSAAAVNAK